MPRYAHFITASALLLLLSLAAYGPALDGELVWDDEAHVTKPELRSLDGLWRIWSDPRATQQYYPLTHSAFWLQYQLWGENTTGYHVVNLMLHLISALLVWAVLRRLAVPGAMLAMAVFALHPVHVESVAWISELKNTLSGVFYLAALLMYLHFDPPSEQSQATRRWWRYCLAFALFLCALLSKTVTASLPAALLLIYWWKQGGLRWRRQVAPLVPWLVVGASMGLMTAWVERHLIGASGAEFAYSWVERGLIAGRVFWFYLGKLLWPSELIFIYPRFRIDASTWWQYLFPIAALVLLAAAWSWRRRIGRGPVTALLFFGGTLVPALGFVDVYPFRFSFVADHFQYLASLGIITVVCSAMAVGIERIGSSVKTAGLIAGGLLVVVLAFLSWRQSGIYSDPVTLWLDTTERNPDCFIGFNNLGLRYTEQGRYAEAVQAYESAIVAKPDLSVAHFNLGGVHSKLGRHVEAIESYQAALAIDPELAQASYNMGIAYGVLDQPSEAAAAFRSAIAVVPDFVDAHHNLAVAYAKLGKNSEAISELETVLRLKPDDPEVYFEKGVIHGAMGESLEAAEAYSAAIAMKPDYFGGVSQARNRIGPARPEGRRCLCLPLGRDASWPAWPIHGSCRGVSLGVVRDARQCGGTLQTGRCIRPAGQARSGAGRLARRCERRSCERVRPDGKRFDREPAKIAGRLSEQARGACGSAVLVAWMGSVGPHEEGCGTLLGLGSLGVRTVYPRRPRALTRRACCPSQGRPARIVDDANSQTEVTFMFYRKPRSLFSLLTLVSLFCGAVLFTSLQAPLEAQGTFGRIIINVIDENGDPVAGVPVTATCELLPRFKGKAKTNKKGKASISVVDATKVYQVTIAPENAPPITEEIKPAIGAAGTERTVQLGGGSAPVATEGAPEERTYTPAQTAFNEGVDALKENDLGSAEAGFKKALELEPDLAAAHSALAGLYVTKKDYEAALASAQKAEDLEGESARLHRVRYEAHRGLGNDSEASKALKALGRLGEGGDAAALAFNRGADALRLGDLPAARVAFDEALEINSDLVPALNALSTVNLLEQKWSEAVTTSERALALDPSNTSSLRMRYEASRQLGDSQRTEEAFAALAAVDPASLANEEYERGTDLFNAGQTEAAIESLERTLSLKPDHPHAHYRLGLSYLALEDNARARQHLERFVALAPEDSEVPSAKEMLQYLE